MRRIPSIVLAALIGIAAHVPSLAAQQPAAARPRVPASVAMVERLPQPDAPYVILRRPDVAPHDVILLRMDADETALSEAVRGLLLARSRAGDHPGSRTVLRVRSSGGRPHTGPRPFPWARRVIEDLRRSAPRDVPHVGVARMVDIHLPAQGPRTK